MEVLFTKDIVPDGLFANNDTSAIAAIEYAKENNISVPGRLRIAGYSNDPRTAIITPSVTSVEQFPNLVGKRIVETLVELLKTEKGGQMYKTDPVIIPVELITRASTATD